MDTFRKIYRDRSDFYPKMIFDKEKGIFLIEGRSLPEDSEAVYGPVLEWLDEYGVADTAIHEDYEYEISHNHYETEYYRRQYEKTHSDCQR